MKGEVTLAPDRVSLKAPAKINLYLEVTGRREDGYHYLATLMQKISLYDRIEIEQNESGIRLFCPDSDLPEDNSNLAFRAAQLFLDRLQRQKQRKVTGVEVTLRKAIPVAAGLGGGSSDAAAVLRGMNLLFSSPFPDDDLLEMGLSLGADVPFFVAECPVAWATGIGEQLQKAVPLTDYKILVVNPGFSVSTPWVYENFALTVVEKINNLKNFQNPESKMDCQDVFLNRSIRPDELMNDLEKVTSSHYPEIEQLKTRLVQGGADVAMMSGSGPTVFALFQTSEAERAAACAQELKKEYQSVFLVDPLQS